MGNSKEQTSKQKLQPNKTCKCGACVPLPKNFGIKLRSSMRSLKVYSPDLVLGKGVWLRNTGFNTGDEIIVTVNKKQLIVDFKKG